MNAKRLKEIIKNFKNQKIAVIGDIILDKYIDGTVKRISPEAPVPVFEKKEEFYRPGGASNVAENLKTLGAKVYLFGVIGDDEEGRILKRIFKKSNNIIIEKNRKTTKKTRVISGIHQILRIDWEDKKPISNETEQELLLRINNENFSTIVVSDYAKGVITEKILKGLTKLRKERNIKIIVDPKPENIHLYKGVDGITPNLKEAIAILNIKTDNCRILLSKLIKRFSLSWAIITKGGDGVCGREKGKKTFRFPALKKEVYDVTGAGDTFVAALSISIASGATIKEAAFIANLSSAYTVMRLGTSAPSTIKILEEYNEWKRKKLF